MVEDSRGKAKTVSELVFKKIEFHVEEATQAEEVRSLRSTRMEVLDDVCRGLVIRLTATVLGKAYNEHVVRWAKPGIKNGMRIRWKWARKLFGPIEYASETVTQYRICPHVTLPEKDPKHYAYTHDGELGGFTLEADILRRESDACKEGAAAGWTTAMEQVQDLIDRGIEMNTHGTMVKFDRTNPLLHAFGIDVRRLKMKSDWQRFFDQVNESKQATADNGYEEGYAAGRATMRGEVLKVIKEHDDQSRGLSYPLHHLRDRLEEEQREGRPYNVMGRAKADAEIAGRDWGWEQFRTWLLEQLERGFGGPRSVISTKNHDAVRALHKYVKGMPRPQK